MVELRTRTREDEADYHKKLGLKRISCASHCTILNTAGTMSDLTITITDTHFFSPYQVSRTPDVSYPLVSSTPFSSLSPISLFLVHNSTIIAERIVKSSLPISPFHDHELTLSTAYTEYRIHWVQHTPSTAYTEYSIHRIQHTPSPAYT